MHTLSTLFTLAILAIPSVSFGDVSYYCSTTSDFHNTYGGRGASQEEARTNALQACTAGAGNGMFCENQVSCSAAGRPDYRRWAPPPVSYYCSITSDFHNTYGGRGASPEEARTNALQACTAGAGNGMFCEDEPSCSEQR